MQAKKSTTITLSNDSRTKIGGKVTAEYGGEGKGGVPFIAEATASFKMGIEVSGEHEWGSSSTDRTTVSRTYTVTKEDEVEVLLGSAWWQRGGVPDESYRAELDWDDDGGLCRWVNEGVAGGGHDG
jgi:hypothetical protein